MDILKVWLDRVENAMLAARGLKFEFHTSFQSTDGELAQYHAHNGQHVEIVGLIIDPTNAPDFDEEALPYYTGRFADGVELVIGDEEIFTNDPRLEELSNAVCSGFAIARDMDYVGPYDLVARGSDADKARFVELVATFNEPKPVNFNTPAAYRILPVQEA